MDELTLQDAHGVDVFYRRWDHGQPRASVVVAHGASEHSGRYDRFATALHAAGYATYALDHRGHGRTSAVTGVGMLGPGGGEAMVDDVHELVAIARRDHPDVRVVLFGHSMGSMIGLAYTTRHSDGLAASVLCGFPAPVDGTGMELLAGIQAAVDAGMGDEPADLLSSLNDAFEPGARTPFDWLSRDPDEVDRYIADPYCGSNHPLTYGFFAGLFGIVAPAAEPDALGAIRCPVLVIAGDQDPAAGMGALPTALDEKLRELGVSSTLRLYPDARHELLNETNRDDVTADVIAWIGERIG